MKWRFAEGEIWGFDNLDEEEKQEALDAGCKPGRKYHGSPGEFQNEVPQCPFCGLGFMYYRDVSCEHMVFVYDYENSEYIEIDPDFLNYFWQRIFPKMRKNLDAETIKDYESLEESSLLPSYWDLKDLVPSLVFFQVDDYVFYSPPIWGFASPTLLQTIQAIKKI